METLTLILIAVITFLVSAWLLRRKNSLKLLPGPTGLPLVGYLPFMTSRPYIKLQQLAEVYGPVYRIKLGGQNVVVLCDFASIKEAFASDAFMGRPADLPFDLNEESIRTGAFLGMPWKEQRRFSMQLLRDLGFGKTRMEEHIREEIQELLQRINEAKQAPIETSSFLAPSMSNNIASLIFGNRLKYSDPKRQQLDRVLNEIGLLAGTLSWQIFFPWLRAVMVYFKLGSNGRLAKAISELRDYVRAEMIHHEETLDPNNIRDFMDSYILEIRKKKDDPNTTFKNDILEDLARGFFTAGSETVRLSVSWLLIICAAYPEVQRRIHAEIDEVIGPDGFPTRMDSVRMPYTEAVTLELNRWRTIVPLNIMRSTLKDTELNGYFIPKGWQVVAILWAVHHDKKLWGEDTDIFRPERFLEKDERTIVKPEYFIPFSIGKRACPGKSLAEVEVFLYLTAILQKFKVSLQPGKKADFDGTLGIGLMPNKQGICFESR